MQPVGYLSIYFTFYLKLASSNLATKSPCVSNQQIDIFTPSGAYIKTACVIKKAATHDGNYVQCSNRNMKLFVIDATSTETQLYAFLKANYGSSPGPTLWVDGIKDTTDNQWYYHSYGKTPAFAPLTWNFGLTAETATGCMITCVSGGLWGLNGAACTKTSYPVCEYIK